MSLASVLSLFNDNYDGFQAARVKSALECVNLEGVLRRAKLSYKTKIIKNKKHGVSFIVMIVEKEWAVDAETRG